MREATEIDECLGSGQFVSIRASREGGDGQAVLVPSHWRFVSIRASREGGDSVLTQTNKQINNVSIRASREGGDVMARG